MARDIIPNTERSYKNTVRLVNEARLAGLLDWDAIEDRSRGFLAALSFFDGGDGFQVAESFGEGQVPDAVMLLVPNQDNATYSVRGDGNVEFESTGAVI